MVQENAFKRGSQITSVKLRGNKNRLSLRCNNDFLAASEITMKIISELLGRIESRFFEYQLHRLFISMYFISISAAYFKSLLLPYY